MYSQTPEKYAGYQQVRPDYVPAIAHCLSLAAKHSPRKKPTVVDFGSGPGHTIRDFASLVGGVERAILIDIHEDFLKQAESLKIDADTMELVHANIVDAEPTAEADILLAAFSYHHLP